MAQITDTLKTYAKDLGLDVAKFETDLASPAVADRVARDQKSGDALKIARHALVVSGWPPD